MEYIEKKDKKDPRKPPQNHPVQPSNNECNAVTPIEIRIIPSWANSGGAKQPPIQSRSQSQSQSQSQSYSNICRPANNSSNGGPSKKTINSAPHSKCPSIMDIKKKDSPHYITSHKLLYAVNECEGKKAFENKKCDGAYIRDYIECGAMPHPTDPNLSSAFLRHCHCCNKLICWFCNLQLVTPFYGKAHREKILEKFYPLGFIGYPRMGKMPDPEFRFDNYIAFCFECVENSPYSDEINKMSSEQLKILNEQEEREDAEKYAMYCSDDDC